jgi:hypothetical protein
MPNMKYTDTTWNSAELLISKYTYLEGGVSKTKWKIRDTAGKFPVAIRDTSLNTDTSGVDKTGTGIPDTKVAGKNFAILTSYCLSWITAVLSDPYLGAWSTFSSRSFNVAPSLTDISNTADGTQEGIPYDLTPTKFALSYQPYIVLYKDLNAKKFDEQYTEKSKVIVPTSIQIYPSGRVENGSMNFGMDVAFQNLAGKTPITPDNNVKYGLANATGTTVPDTMIIKYTDITFDINKNTTQIKIDLNWNSDGGFILVVSTSEGANVKAPCHFTMIQPIFEYRDSDEAPVAIVSMSDALSLTKYFTMAETDGICNDTCTKITPKVRVPNKTKSLLITPPYTPYATDSGSATQDPLKQTQSSYIASIGLREGKGNIFHSFDALGIRKIFAPTEIVVGQLQFLPTYIVTTTSTSVRGRLPDIYWGPSALGPHATVVSSVQDKFNTADTATNLKFKKMGSLYFPYSGDILLEEVQLPRLKIKNIGGMASDVGKYSFTKTKDIIPQWTLCLEDDGFFGRTYNSVSGLNSLQMNYLKKCKVRVTVSGIAYKTVSGVKIDKKGIKSTIDLTPIIQSGTNKGKLNRFKDISASYDFPTLLKKGGLKNNRNENITELNLNENSDFKEIKIVPQKAIKLADTLSNLGVYYDLVDPYGAVIQKLPTAEYPETSVSLSQTTGPDNYPWVFDLAPPEFGGISYESGTRDTVLLKIQDPAPGLLDLSFGSLQKNQDFSAPSSSAITDGLKLRISALAGANGKTAITINSIDILDPVASDYDSSDTTRRKSIVLRLNLASAIPSNQTLTVIYTPPASITPTTIHIRDRAGNVPKKLTASIPKT